MDIDKMTLRVQKALSDANVIAVKYNHQQIEVIHLFAALMDQEDGLIPNILNKMGINNKEVTAKIDAKLSSMPKVLGEGANSSGVYITRQVNEVLVKAEEISKKLEFYKDAIDTALESGKEELAEEVPVEAAPEEAPAVETETPVVEEVTDTVSEEKVEEVKE